MRKRSRPPSGTTDGEAILYGGVPILAVFHSCSAGQTRAAGQVWVSDLPYLQAVYFPGACGRHPQLLQPGGIHGGGVSGEGAGRPIRRRTSPATSDGWLQNAVTDSAGSVETVDVGGVSSEGQHCYGASWGCGPPALSGRWQDGKLVFFVTGYGHGVGMSQYGANQMAKEGADYRTILTHYYTGVTVEPYTTAAIG